MGLRQSFNYTRKAIQTEADINPPILLSSVISPKPLRREPNRNYKREEILLLYRRK